MTNALDRQIQEIDQAAERASEAGDQHGIGARFDPYGLLTAFTVPANAPLRFATDELATILTTVLQTAFDASQTVSAALLGGGFDQEPVMPPDLTYAEASRHGDLMIAVDSGGRVRWCTLTQAAGGWDADTLAHRILLLHNAASMRVNSITPTYGTAIGDGLKDVYVTEEKIAQYRLNLLNF